MRRASRGGVPRLAASLVWAVLAGSIVFWALRLFSAVQPVPPQIRTVEMNQSVQGDALRLFGPPRATAVAVVEAAPAASRFRLHGVVAGVGAATARAGVVTLSVDGGPPRAYRVGDAVDAEWVVQAISRQAVKLGPGTGTGSAAVVLDVPALASASSGIGVPMPQEPVPSYGAPGAEAPPLQMMEPPSAGMPRVMNRASAPGGVPASSAGP